MGERDDERLEAGISGDSANPDVSDSERAVAFEGDQDDAQSQPGGRSLFARMVVFLSIFALAFAVIGTIVGIVMILVPQTASATVLSEQFEDVPDDAWYVVENDTDGGKYLDYVVTKGYMRGSGSGTFNPEGELSRGQLATILYRIANPNSTDTTVEADYASDSGFTDTPAEPYYYNAALAWCKQEGIMTGDKDNYGVPLGVVRPEDNITRQDFATMMFRFAEYSGLDTSGVTSDGLESFPDKDEVADYAKLAVAWCVTNGLISGKPDPDDPDTLFLAPNENATRAQAAKIIAVFARDVLPDAALLAQQNRIIASLPTYPIEGYEAQVVLTDDGTLTIRPAGAADGETGAAGSAAGDAAAGGATVVATWDNILDPKTGRVSWALYLDQIESVVVDDGVAPTSIANWFRDLPNCTEMDLSGLDTSEVTDMSYAFAGCDSLESVDTTGWDTSSVENMDGVFSGCESLVDAGAEDWDTGAVTSMLQIFEGSSVTEPSWYQGDMKTMLIDYSTLPL